MEKREEVGREGDKKIEEGRYMEGRKGNKKARRKGKRKKGR